jgi:DNA excision repair protein ERCC-2
MAPRFDAERSRVELSVADLLDSRLARHLGFANRGGYERLWLGQAIHSRYQQETLENDPTYRREVHLSHTFEHRGWEVTVQGRADGIRREREGVLVVEEIKSVRRGGDLPPATQELYRRQACLYAWLLKESGETAPIFAELVLIEIGTDRLLRDPLEVDFDVLETEIRERLDRLLLGFERSRAAYEARRAAAERLTFPFPETRPGQEDIVAATETALEHGEHVLIEAPTGIGKTVAALYPALKHALATDKKVFVLTAKTLQQEMAATVLALLNREGSFRSLRLRAKSKMCANDQVLCHEEYCPYAKDYYGKLASTRILDKLLEAGDLLDPDAIYDRARASRVCPFEVSLELGRKVQVTVCDYNYAFDPYVSLTDFGPDQDLSDTILVVDEIHNLVDRGRGYYSPELSARMARQAAQLAERGLEPIYQRVGALSMEVARLVEEAVEMAFELAPNASFGWRSGGDDFGGGTSSAEPRERAIETMLPEDQLWMLRQQLDQVFIEYLEHQKETRTLAAEDPFVDLYFTYLRFLNGIVVSDEAFSHLAEVRTGPDGKPESVLKILCKDPSSFLGRVIGRTHSTLGLSATLSPPEFYQDLLGFPRGRTAHVSVPSPFPPENRRVVIDGSVHTTYKKRPQNYGRIAERLAELAEAVPGNCLVLFPSYRFLYEVSGFLPVTGKRVLIQERASGDREREAILDALRSALLQDVLLLAVAGGVFAEGVDYPGDMLKAVAVVGPCLPALTLERELLRAYYEERFDRGFEYAYVVPGMTRVIQAAGRLIRSPTDEGIIALLDQRFLHRPYREYLPEDWAPDADLKALTGHPGRAAVEFFDEWSRAQRAARSG